MCVIWGYRGYISADMAWEVYKREVSRDEAPAVSVSTSGRIGLNGAAALHFREQKASRVDLLWDSASGKIGIRASRSKVSFPLTGSPKRRGAIISAIPFLNYIKYDWTTKRSFSATWDVNESILTIEIPCEHLRQTEALRRSGGFVVKGVTKPTTPP